METRIARITISLLILATQAITIFTAEEHRKKSTPHKSTLHQLKKKPHGSGSHKGRKPRQKPKNPLGKGFHYCDSGHINFGIGCQKPKGTCSEDPKSPNYKYRD